MLSVLVCHSYFLHLDRKQQERAKPYPPLATLHAAAMLREAGLDVALFDAMLARGVSDFDDTMRRTRPQVVVFYEDNYNFLSKMCLGRMRGACLEMIRNAVDAGARVVVAGSDASDAPEIYLEAGADAVLLGEALATLMALADRLTNDPTLSGERMIAGLDGVASTALGEPRRSAAAAPLPTSELPRRPAWDLVDIAAYRAIWKRAHGSFSLNMAASRGCSFRCNWCAKPIWGNRYLQRPADDVADEMRYLRDDLGVEHVWFADDIFGFRVDWVERFAAALDDRGVPFTIQSRADLIRDDMAKALASAGCDEVWIGAESGSQRILDEMNKGTTVDSIVEARRALRRHGIRTGFFLMLGYLGETLDDVLATRRLVDAARPDDVGVSVAYPLPGTPFFDTVAEQLGPKRNWQESNDLEMMFAGTYRTEFYRIVRNLLHEQVDGAPTADLDRRWRELIRREPEFRAQQLGAAAIDARH